MKLNRAFLATELDILKPALSDKPDVPGLDLIWFDGTTVVAFNGLIGIKKPLTTDFTGGVFGKVLIGYLEKIVSDEVEFESFPDVHDLKISAKQSNLRLPLSEIENRLWDLPEYDPKTGITLTKDFMNLIEFCLVSINKNTVDVEQTGLTLEATRKELNIYTTDTATACWACLPKPKNYTYDRLCIPGEFWEQVLKICLPEDTLYLSPTSAIVVNRAGTTLYGRILDIETPRPYQERISTWINEIDYDMIGIPHGLDSALDRAELLRQGRAGEPAQFSILDNNLNLYLKTPMGELKDDLDLAEGHPEVVTLLDPALIKRALAERNLFALNKQRLIMTGPNSFVHIISAMHK